jgi:hypothetical protein
MLCCNLPKNLKDYQEERLAFTEFLKSKFMVWHTASPLRAHNLRLSTACLVAC